MIDSAGLGRPLTITLIPTAEADLQMLTERTELSPTDLANRAITLYEFFDRQVREGRDMISRDRVTGETLLVQLTDDATAPPEPVRGSGLGWPGELQPDPVIRRKPRHPSLLLPVAGLALLAVLIRFVGLSHGQ